MNKETELAWCAGFFDGEGNIGCFHHRKGTVELTLQISQKDRRILDRFRWFMKNNGFYSSEIAVRGPYFSSHKNGIYKLVIINSNAFRVFEAMKSYLGEVKLEQGELAINKWKENRGYLKVVT